MTIYEWFTGGAALSGVVAPLILWRIARRQAGERAADRKHQDAANAKLSGEVKEVHILVNSDKTAAYQDKCDALGRELILLKMVVDLHRNAGKEPSRESLNEITNTELKIVDLKKLLAERAVEAETVKAQQERAAAVAGEG